jgi:hypothetical protein
MVPTFRMATRAIANKRITSLSTCALENPLLALEQWHVGFLCTN